MKKFPTHNEVMGDDRSDDDPIMDLWYSNWEQQSVEEIESQPDYESQLHNENAIYSQQIWTGFQTTASAIAQLYKGKKPTVNKLMYINYLITH